MRHPNDRPAAPNYTAACVVMFGVNLTWILMVIWALWGMLAVIATGWLLNRVIGRIETLRHG